MTNRAEKIYHLLLCLTVFGALAAAVLMQTGNGKQGVQPVAEEPLRFRILANSDSREDQELKFLVGEKIAETMKDQKPDSMTKKDAVIWWEKQCPKIEEIAGNAVREAGYDYPVEAQIRQERFPASEKNGIQYSAGKYDALVVEIGEAKGHNWWCLLYPSLGLSDLLRKVPEDEGAKEDLVPELENDPAELMRILKQPGKIRFTFRFWKG